MATNDAQTETAVHSPEVLIGKLVLGFLGDPEELPDHDKWRLYDALLEAASILGEVVTGAWQNNCLADETHSGVDPTEASCIKADSSDPAA